MSIIHDVLWTFVMVCTLFILIVLTVFRMITTIQESHPYRGPGQLEFFPEPTISSKLLRSLERKKNKDELKTRFARLLYSLQRTKENLEKRLKTLASNPFVRSSETKQDQLKQSEVTFRKVCNWITSLEIKYENGISIFDVEVFLYLKKVRKGIKTIIHELSSAAGYDSLLTSNGELGNPMPDMETTATEFTHDSLTSLDLKDINESMTMLSSSIDTSQFHRHARNSLSSTDAAEENETSESSSMFCRKRESHKKLLHKDVKTSSIFTKQSETLPLYETNNCKVAQNAGKIINMKTAKICNDFENQSTTVRDCLMSGTGDHNAMNFPAHNTSSKNASQSNTFHIEPNPRVASKLKPRELTKRKLVSDKEGKNSNNNMHLSTDYKQSKAPIVLKLCKMNKKPDCFENHQLFKSRKKLAKSSSKKNCGKTLPNDPQQARAIYMQVPQHGRQKGLYSLGTESERVFIDKPCTNRVRSIHPCLLSDEQYISKSNTPKPVYKLYPVKNINSPEKTINTSNVNVPMVVNRKVKLNGQSLLMKSKVVGGKFEAVVEKLKEQPEASIRVLDEPPNRQIFCKVPDPIFFRKRNTDVLHNVNNSSSKIKKHRNKTANNVKLSNYLKYYKISSSHLYRCVTSASSCDDNNRKQCSSAFS